MFEDDSKPNNFKHEMNALTNYIRIPHITYSGNCLVYTGLGNGTESIELFL